MTFGEFSYTGATITSDSEYNASYTAAKLFDNDPATWWNTLIPVALPCYVKIDFGAVTAHIVTRYTWMNYLAAGCHPTAWKFYGSNDDSSYTELDSQTGQSFTYDEIKTYNFINTVAYRYYKWIFSAITSNQIAAKEAELWGDDTPFIIPGGVSLGSANMICVGC